MMSLAATPDFKSPCWVQSYVVRRKAHISVEESNAFFYISLSMRLSGQHTIKKAN